MLTGCCPKGVDVQADSLIRRQPLISIVALDRKGESAGSCRSQSEFVPVPACVPVPDSITQKKLKSYK